MMDNLVANNKLAFLKGGGEMGALIRAKDWSKTAVGLPGQWPQSLKTALSIILNSKFPMFLFWGKDLICFYNDAYRPSLGQNGKHPSILGMKASQAWFEIWEVIKPHIRQVMSGGEATWSEDQLIPIYRNGKMEDVYWTFSYSAMNDDDGNVAGVFITCQETTGKVANLSLVNETKDQLEFAIEATELGVWDLNPLTNKFTANDRLKDWFGLLPEDEIDLPLALAVIADSDRAKVVNAIEKALHFSSGGKYDIEYSIIHPSSGKERMVKAKGRAWFNEDEVCYRFNGTLQDVTSERLVFKKIEDSEKEFRSLADSLPELVWTTDNKGAQTFASRRWKEYTGLDPYDQSTFSLMVHSEDLPNVLKVWTDSLTSGKFYKTEARLKSKTGEYQWFYAMGEPIKNENGEIEKWVGAFTNVNELKIAQENLRLTSERFRLLADSMLQFVWTADAFGNLDYFNKAVYDYSGLTAEEIKIPDGYKLFILRKENKMLSNGKLPLNQGKILFFLIASGAMMVSIAGS